MIIGLNSYYHHSIGYINEVIGAPRKMLVGHNKAAGFSFSSGHNNGVVIRQGSTVTLLFS